MSNSPEVKDEEFETRTVGDDEEEEDNDEDDSVIDIYYDDVSADFYC
jgi:hypothetical protein